jgi:hypothetical protein
VVMEKILQILFPQFFPIPILVPIPVEEGR